MRARVSWSVLAGVVVAVAAAWLGGGGPAFAQPQVPASFYGTASIDGHALPDGTEIAAIIDGKDCTQPGGNGTIVEGSASVYVINVMHESQAPGCGAEGKSIAFRVGTRDAAQTATWHTGLQRLDLNAGSGNPAPLPPEANSTVSEAGKQATATEQAKFTPRTGSPPTDDVSLTTTPSPKGTVGGVPAKGNDDRAVSPILAILVVLVVLIGVGAAGGVGLSRRGRPPRS